MAFRWIVLTTEGWSGIPKFKIFENIDNAEKYREEKTEYKIAAHVYYDYDRLYYKNQQDLDNRDILKEVDNLQILKVKKH